MSVVAPASHADPVLGFARLRRTWSEAWPTLRADALAGVTVAAISLPQSMAYALIAGVDPRFGLYAAIVFAAVAGALGSSRHLVNGPTGAVSLVVFSALAFLDPGAPLDVYEAMFLLAVLAGVVQIVIAVARLGDLTRYISESVLTGFIAGAAALTVLGQLANALGLKAQGDGHQHILHRLWLTLGQGASANPRAIAISVSAIGLALLGRALVRRWRLPPLEMLAVLVLLTLAAWALGWSVHEAGGKPAIALIEIVPASLPGFHIPVIQWRWLLDLGGSALAVGVLGLLEALAIAKAIALKSGQRLDYNRQILAEGVGNLVGGFFQAMPGAGSLSRTAINYQAGARTRWSGVFAAVVVAGIVLVLGPLSAYVPKAALAGLLIVAASRLIDVRRAVEVARRSVYDALVLVVTALSAVLVDVEAAILIGVIVSVAGYISRAARLKSRELIVAPDGVVRERHADEAPDPRVLILDLEGELFFGAAPELERTLGEGLRLAGARGARTLVLRLRRARNPDIVAVEVIETFLRTAEVQGYTVLLAGVRADLLGLLRRSAKPHAVPGERIFAEDGEIHSATLRAIRAALLQAGQPDLPAPAGTSEGRYYLV